MRNKQVIKFLSLGLGAVTAFSTTPIAAHAEEIETTVIPPVELHSEDEYLAAQAEATLIYEEPISDVTCSLDGDTETLSWQTEDAFHKREIVSETIDEEDTSTTEITKPLTATDTYYDEPIYDHTDEDGDNWYIIGEETVSGEEITTTTNENITQKTTVTETTTTIEKETVADAGIYEDNQDLAEIKELLGDYGITANEVNINNDCESNINAGELETSTADIGTNPNYIYKYDEDDNTSGDTTTIESVSENVDQIKLKNNSSIEFEMDNTTASNEGKADGYYDVTTPEGTVEVTNVTNIEIKDASFNDVEDTLDKVEDLAVALAANDTSEGVLYSQKDLYNKDLDVSQVENDSESKYDVVFATVNVKASYDVDWIKVNNMSSAIDWSRYNSEGDAYFAEIGCATLSDSKLEGFENTGSMHITMNDNQIIVINVAVGDSNSIVMNKFSVITDGQEVGSDVFNQSTSKLSQQIMFNFGDYAGDINIKSSVMGTIIAPKAHIIVDSTSTGQIACDNFTNQSGEWHYTGNSASQEEITTTTTEVKQWSFFYKSEDQISTEKAEDEINYIYDVIDDEEEEDDEPEDDEEFEDEDDDSEDDEEFEDEDDDSEDDEDEDDWDDEEDDEDSEDEDWDEEDEDDSEDEEDLEDDDYEDESDDEDDYEIYEEIFVPANDFFEEAPASSEVTEETIPSSTPVIIEEESVPLAESIPENTQEVLGAKRQPASTEAVLGARRDAKTADAREEAMALNLSIIAATVGLSGLWFGLRRKSK